MSTENRPEMPRAQIVYGEIIYWIAIVAAIICMIGPVIAMSSVEDNVLNPHYLFASIFDGKDAQEIWSLADGGFPGGHFYLDNFTTGDGFTQFGLALGCGCAIWGLLAAAFCYLKEKNYLYMFLAVWVVLLIFLSAIGIVKGH